MFLLFRRVQNRPKIVMKTILNDDAKAARKKVPKSVQHDPQNGPKLGLCWPWKRSWTRPRAKKKRHRKPHRKKHQKHTQHKPVLANEREARSSLKTWEECRWEMRNVGYFTQAQEQAHASTSKHTQAQTSTSEHKNSTSKHKQAISK